MLKGMTFAVSMAALITMSIGSNAAEPGSVFGMKLRQPLAIPACPYETADGKAFYAPPQAGACYELTFGDGPGEVDDASRIVGKVPANGPVVIVWEVADKPAIISGRGAMAMMAGGKLQRVVFETRGVRSQDEVYQTLVGQFGTATSTLKIPLAGESTAALSMLAKWTLDRVDVLFYSAVEGLDKGVVSISAHPSKTQLSSNSTVRAGGRARL